MLSTPTHTDETEKRIVANAIGWAMFAFDRDTHETTREFEDGRDPVTTEFIQCTPEELKRIDAAAERALRHLAIHLDDQVPLEV